MHACRYQQPCLVPPSIRLLFSCPCFTKLQGVWLSRSHALFEASAASGGLPPFFTSRCTQKSTEKDRSLYVRSCVTCVHSLRVRRDKQGTRVQRLRLNGTSRRVYHRRLQSECTVITVGSGLNISASPAFMMSLIFDPASLTLREVTDRPQPWLNIFSTKPATAVNQTNTSKFQHLRAGHML